MNTCECGSLADGIGITCHRCAALHELGLKTGATEAEVKTAYRLYVKAWHPDRFPGDEKSKSAAQEKLKTINSAYNFLTSLSSKKYQAYRPNTTPPPAKPQERTQQPPPVGGRSQTSSPKGNMGGQTPIPTPSMAHRWGILLGKASRHWGYLLYVLPGATVVGFLVLSGAISTSSNHSPQPTSSNSVEIKGVPPGSTVYTIDNSTQPAFSLPNGTEIRKRRHLNGHGELTVENGTLDDAVVNLVDLHSMKTIRTFYIKTDKTFTERQIPPGFYGVYFTTGIDWNVSLKAFNLNPSYKHFGKNLEYTEKIDEDTEKVAKIIYTISLQPVQGGNAEIDISDKDFFDKIVNDGTTD